MAHRETTDSPLAAAGYLAPPPADLDRLTAITRAMRVPFAFSHSTAAGILGWPRPWAEQVVGDLHVMTDSDAGRIRLGGFVGHRGLESREVVDRYGLPVVSPAHTWVDLGELVGQRLPYSFQDIIGAGDQALNAGCTKSDLRAIIEARVRPRGKRTLLPALAWMRIGSESMLETQWRLVCHRAGLPIPALNRNVYDIAGDFLFRPDLAWRPKRIAAECQGSEVHDNPEAVARDSERMLRAKRHEWTIFEVRSVQVWDKVSRDLALKELAQALGFPEGRLDLCAAEPAYHSPEAAATLFENLERRRRRARARYLATR